jgi:hypothetical protein
VLRLHVPARITAVAMLWPRREKGHMRYWRRGRDVHRGKQVPSRSQSSSGSNTVGGQASSARINPENLLGEHHDEWVAAIDRLNKK